MACSVRCSRAAVGLTTFPIFEGLTTEGSLIDFSVFCSGEGDTEVFQLEGNNLSASSGQRICETDFNNSIRGFTSHVVNCVLIA